MYLGFFPMLKCAHGLRGNLQSFCRLLRHSREALVANSPGTRPTAHQGKLQPDQGTGWGLERGIWEDKEPSCVFLQCNDPVPGEKPGNTTGGRCPPPVGSQSSQMKRSGRNQWAKSGAPGRDPPKPLTDHIQDKRLVHLTSELWLKRFTAPAPHPRAIRELQRGLAKAVRRN